MYTITAANSVYALSVTGLYASPQILKGYAADDAFATEAVETAETVMGIDGHLSGGFVFNPVKQIIHIMPDSESLDIFDNWRLAQVGTREVYVANAAITLPAIGKKYALTRGFLTSFRPIPEVKKTLQPIEFEITWGSVIAAPL